MTHAGKVADPRYVPGESPHADRMTDTEWVQQMGSAQVALDGTRDVELVFLPRVGLPYSRTVTVDLEAVSRESDGLLTEYLVNACVLECKWRYRNSVTVESPHRTSLA